MDEKYIKLTNENYMRLCGSPNWRADSPLCEKELNSERLYDGRIIKLRVDDVQLPDGSRSKREYVEHRGGAAVLPVDDENFAYFVEQFRYPYREATLEIPAGKLEQGEDPLATVSRELEEETGLQAQKITPFGTIYPSPGYTNEKLYIYVAEGLKYVGEHPDRDEFLHVVRMPFGDALEKVMSGEIFDSKTCFAVLKYFALKSETCKNAGIKL